MANLQVNTNAGSGNRLIIDPSLVTHRAATPSPPRSAKVEMPLVRKITEEFPTLFPPPRGTKSRSLTEAEMADVTDSEVVAMNESLKNSESPLSMAEARERRASIKVLRRDSINFIRARTSSRAAALRLDMPENSRASLPRLRTDSFVSGASLTSPEAITPSSASTYTSRMGMVFDKDDVFGITKDGQ